GAEPDDVLGYAAQRQDRITGVPARVIQSVNSDLFNKATTSLKNAEGDLALHFGVESAPY
ncbi:hypothetical protein, partial [Enterobacter asburiae]|uniref:hypothetical protein n=1 Tax=Enterobacter asburiae TaxID=61645 RepID=UPI00296606D6